MWLAEDCDNAYVVNATIRVSQAEIKIGGISVLKF